MKIQLTRPIAIFDLECTGINITQDKIVEIAILKISPDGKKETYERKINPEVKMTQEIIDIHGITNEELVDCPVFKEVASEIEEFVANCDFGGFNSNKFDVPFLVEEMLRVNSNFDISDRKFLDAQNIFHKMEKRTLSAAYKFYCDKDLINAHSAMADTEATWEVLNAQIERYSELQNDVDFLAEFSTNHKMDMVDHAGRLAKNKENQVVYNFGKHRGKTVEEIMKTEPGYYGWMLHADFPEHTKLCLKKEMERLKKLGGQNVETSKSKPIAKPKFKKDQSQPAKPITEDSLAALQNKFKK
ncbi:MAG: DNA polymerase-3 subunit epsilon [Lentimonas sp.]|jgi:DNA polymerase-3 subunit epsilon